MTTMAALLRQGRPVLGRFSWTTTRGFAASVGSDIVKELPDVKLQKARSWDEGVSSQFSTTPLSELFGGKKVVLFGLPGAFTGVCSAQHVPSYLKNADKFKQKGVDSIVCVAVNDPYVMNGWAEKLQAKETIEFYGDFDGRFHKGLELDLDLSAALLGPRSQRQVPAPNQQASAHSRQEHIKSKDDSGEAKALEACFCEGSQPKRLTLNGSLVSVIERSLKINHSL